MEITPTIALKLKVGYFMSESEDGVEFWLRPDGITVSISLIEDGMGELNIVE